MLEKNFSRQGFGPYRVVGALWVSDDLIGFDSPPESVGRSRSGRRSPAKTQLNPHDEKKKRWRRHG
jgi:hypothetical protein